jgi:hypothetical protein
MTGGGGYYRCEVCEVEGLGARCWCCGGADMLTFPYNLAATLASRAESEASP